MRTFRVYSREGSCTDVKADDFDYDRMNDFVFFYAVYPPSAAKLPVAWFPREVILCIVDEKHEGETEIDE